MKKALVLVGLLIIVACSISYYFYNANHSKLAETLIQSFLNQKNLSKTSYQVTNFNRNNILIENITTEDIPKKISIESVDIKYKQTSVLRQIITNGSFNIDTNDYEKLVSYFPDSFIAKNIIYLLQNNDILEIPLLRISRININSYQTDVYYKFTKAGNVSSGRISLKIKLDKELIYLDRIDLSGDVFISSSGFLINLVDLSIEGKLVFNINKNSLEKFDFKTTKMLTIKARNTKGKHLISLDNIAINGKPENANITLTKVKIDDDAFIFPIDSDLKLKMNAGKMSLAGDIFLNSNRLKLLQYKYKTDLEVKLVANVFGEDGIDLKEVIPFCAKENIDLSGEVNMSIVYPLGNSRKKGSLNSSLKDFSLKYAGLELSYLNTYIKLLNFDFLNSSRNEILKANRVQFGEKLENLELNWHIQNNSLFLRKVIADFLGGKIKLSNYELNFNEKQFSPIVLKLEKLDLYSFLSLGLKEGLIATGQLDGLVNISKNKNEVYIYEGQLASSSRGVVKYKGKIKAGQEGSGTNILFKYLENLNYTKLKVNFKSNDNYDLKTQLNIVGKNPDFNKELRGKPLDLKLNLDMNLRKAFRVYLLSVNLPKLIEKQISEILEKKNDE
jgi:hypothetical protein